MVKTLRHLIVISLGLAASLSGVQVGHANQSVRQAGCEGLTITHFSDPACDAEMAADPRPPVTPLPVDQGALTSYTYLRLLSDEPVVVYDAPNGNPIDAIDPGFNYVTPRTVLDDWVEIDSGQWVRREFVKPITPSHFTGALFDDAITRPIAWTVVDVFASKRPDGPPVYEPEFLLPKYHLTTIYATVEVDGYNWYLVGPDQWVEQRFVGVVTRLRPPEGIHGRWVAIDLYEQTLVAYEDEEMVFATLIASGIAGFSTRTGTFQVWERRLHGPMTGAEGRPDFYLIQNVPFALYYDQDISLHGTYWHDGFGYRRSHGCVNLSLTDAHWLYNWLTIDDWVYVYYSRPYGPP